MHEPRKCSPMQPRQGWPFINHQTNQKTRMYSSRMRTTRSLTVTHISSYPTHAPPPGATMHALTPMSNHACPLGATTHTPQSNHAPPWSNHTCTPEQPHMPLEQKCTPPEQPFMPPPTRATTHAPQSDHACPPSKPIRPPPLWTE